MALKSKTLLFTALDQFFQTDVYTAKKLAAPGLCNETYGRDSMVYVSSKDVAQRAELERFLTQRGFKVHAKYWPGSARSEVQVSYFKGWHHDE